MTCLISEQHVLKFICALTQYLEKPTKISHLKCYLRVRFISVCHTYLKILSSIKRSEFLTGVFNLEREI